MLKDPMKYTLSLAAGAAMLALASGTAGAMPVSTLLSAAPAAQATPAVADPSTDAAKIEKIYWCNHWGCHPGWGWHPWHPWHPWGWGWGWHRHYWHHWHHGW